MTLPSILADNYFVYSIAVTFYYIFFSLLSVPLYVILSKFWLKQKTLLISKIMSFAFIIEIVIASQIYSRVYSLLRDIPSLPLLIFSIPLVLNILTLVIELIKHKDGDILAIPLIVVNMLAMVIFTIVSMVMRVIWHIY